MSVALVLVEHEGGQVKDATLATVTAAAKLGEVHLLVAGEGRRARSPQAAAKIAGVAKVHVADDAAFAHNLAENVAPVAVALVSDHCDYFVAPATTTGKNIAPRVAALLDVMQISDDPLGRGPGHLHPADLCRQRDRDGEVVGRQEGDHRPHHRLREGGARGRQRQRRERLGRGDAGLSSFVGAELSKSERPELTSAKVIVSGGRAFGSSEQFHALLDPLADKLKAGVGASRAAVDAGYAPNDYQVGQTGKIVAPEVYIAIGISGAIQHLAGMKDSKIIVAINKDEDAPDLPGRRHRPGRRPVQDRAGADGEAVASLSCRISRPLMSPIMPATVMPSSVTCSRRPRSRRSARRSTRSMKRASPMAAASATAICSTMSRCRRGAAAGADGPVDVLAPAGAQRRPARPPPGARAGAADRARPEADHQSAPLEGAGRRGGFRLASGLALPPARSGLSQPRHLLCPDRPRDRSAQSRERRHARRARRATGAAPSSWTPRPRCLARRWTMPRWWRPGCRRRRGRSGPRAGGSRPVEPLSGPRLGAEQRPAIAAASTSTAMSGPTDCDRGEWAFRDGEPVPFGAEPALVHYEALRERGEPHYV